MSAGRRVLVATPGGRLPRAALEHAGDLAGPGGALVLAAVLVVPRSQDLAAALDRPVAAACDMLDQAERSRPRGSGDFDTRLVRARSFAEGVLQTLAAEPFELLLVEKGPGAPSDGVEGQLQTLLKEAAVTVMLVRPARAL